MKVRLLLLQPTQRIEAVVYIRFVSGELDPDSHVSAGLFCVAADLESTDLPDYEFAALQEHLRWFARYLASPFDYLPELPRYERSISWFKPTAQVYLARAWELVALLERNNFLIWTIKSARVGHIHYEDKAQVFAQPDRGVRPLLK